MSVASGINVLWTGTHAGVPTGWDRNVTLDTKYVIGAGSGEDGGGTGGQATHVHTADDHGHNTTSHTHSVIPISAVGTLAIDEFAGGRAKFDFDNHSHGVAATAGSAVQSANATGVTMDAIGNDPPYVKVIYIESDGTPAGVADDASVFWEDGTPPTDWNENDGGGTRTDLRNKFLKGADAAGNAGATGGSSDSHTHTEDGTKHTHTMPAHDHGGSGVSALSSSSCRTASSSAAGGLSKCRHTHNYTIASNSQMSLINLVDTAKITTQVGDARPPYEQLKAIQNETGGDDIPDGVICLWFGNRADIPLGWVEVSSMQDNFVRAATASGSGGATQHTHTANSHGHDVNNGGSHSHVVTGGVANQSQNSEVIEETAQASKKDHTHTWIVTTPDPTVTSLGAIVIINSNTAETNFPPYVKGLFVKFDSTLLIDTARSVHTMAIGMGMSRL